MRTRLESVDAVHDSRGVVHDRGPRDLLHVVREERRVRPDAAVLGAVAAALLVFGAADRMLMFV